MRLIGMHTKDRDCKLNRITRNLIARLELEHLGVNLDKKLGTHLTFVHRCTNSCINFTLTKSSSFLSSSLERSRIILNNFVRHVTPNAKIYQLRKVFYSLLYSLPAQEGGLELKNNSIWWMLYYNINKSWWRLWLWWFFPGNFSMMTSDELIPVCAFLIAKSSTNNWWCHLLLMRNFCFSVSHFDQELELVVFLNKIFHKITTVY